MWKTIAYITVSILLSLQLQAQTGAATPHSFDVTNYELHVDLYDNFLPPYPSLFNATEYISFKVDSALSSIQLDAKKSKIVIDSIAFPALSFIQDADNTTITLNTSYNPGDSLTVPIYYHHKDVLDPSYYAYNGYIYTDCEPEGAHNWFVCYDKPTDKATVELFATVPANAALGSNGSLIDTVTIGDTKTFHWKSRDPMCTYLVTMVGKTNYHVDINYWHPLTHPLDSIPLGYYYATGEDIGTVEATMPLMMDYFSNLYGDYPFEKYANASSIEFYSEGMENQSMTIICKNCWSEWLLSHELSHQWFGDLISPKSWADIFMNEGFASYNELLWGTHATGAAALQDSIVDYANYYLALNPGFPIAMSYWAEHTPPFDTLFNDVITYTKAPCVIHMLRNVVGDSAFFATLKAYTTDTFNFRFKNVSIGDFNNFFNTATGMDLNYFFDEWIWQPNHPVYANNYTAHPLIDGSDVEYTIHQVQSDPPFFTMPADLQFHFIDGADSVVTVLNNMNDQTFDFHFTKQVTDVVFDPFNKIVLKEATFTSEITQKPQQTLNIFPNPVKDLLQVEFSLPAAGAAVIKMVNMQGQQIFTKTYLCSPGVNSISVSTECLPEGTYLISVNSGNFVHSSLVERLR